MSEEKSIALLDETPFLDIAAVSDEYNAIVRESTNEFAIMMITAKAVKAIRALLGDDIINAFKQLENSKLGFKTDKGNGGYPIAVIRDCLIEAHLGGVKVIGNEFNIIAGQMYITKEGFTGKMQRSPDFSKVKLNIGIPNIDQPANRAVLKCSATWNFTGRPDSIECEIPVKWDKYSSDDAMIAKAERKLRARIWTQATGDIMPEGDAGEYTDNIRVVDVSASDEANGTGYMPTESFNEMFPQWEGFVLSGKKTPEQLLAFLESKDVNLSPEQKQAISDIKMEEAV